LLDKYSNIKLGCVRPEKIMPEWLRDAWAHASAAANPHRPAHVSDIVRLLLMHAAGGAYRDTDIISLDFLEAGKPLIGTAGVGEVPFY